MNSAPIVLLTSLALASAAHAQTPAQDPSGLWLTENGTSRVRIARCGSVYCGTIVAVTGDAKDRNNPDPRLRSRSLVGVRMFNDGRPSQEGGWTGSLYNPLDGRTYSGTLKMKGPNALELSGCVLAGLICRSQTWSRVH